jgi:O-antigen biosynthesis protein
MVFSPTLFSLLPQREKRLQPIYIKYSRNRFPQFQIETNIIQDNLHKRHVVKKALSEQANGHIEAIYQGYCWMKDAILDASINQPKIIEKKDHQIVFEFIDGKSLDNLLFQAFLDGEKIQYLQCVDRYHDLLFHSFKTVKEFCLTTNNEMFLENVDMDFIEREGVYFPHAFLDVVMDNILMTSDGKYYCIDYEWIIPTSIPVAFVFFRSLAGFYGFKYGEFNVEGFLPFTDLMNRYGITSSHLDQYAKIEKNFQRHVVGEDLYNRGRYLKRRVFLNELLSDMDGTKQRQILTYEENIRQFNRTREAMDAVVRQSEAERERLIEQIKTKDDMIALLCDSYSMKIGQTILFPFRYIKTKLFPH